MGIDDELEGVAGSWRSDVAADARRRRTSAQSREAQSADFAGIATDLAERAAQVVVCTVDGRRVAGTLRAVGEDFLALHLPDNTTTYVSMRAITALLAPGEERRAPAERTLADRASLAMVLSELAQDRPWMMVRGRDGIPLSGRLLDVGSDLLRLRLEDGAGTIAYVALWSLAEASVTGSG